jgi:hypothetical protein
MKRPCGYLAPSESRSRGFSPCYRLKKRERRRLVGIQALAMRLLMTQDSASFGAHDALGTLVARAIDALIDGETDLAFAALKAAQDELERLGDLKAAA